jgi:RNAse (barnase) inhibitor barstar
LQREGVTWCLSRRAAAANGLDLRFALRGCEDVRMAPFRLGHDELQHSLPWMLMQNGPVTKYWRREHFNEDIGELTRLEFQVISFDTSAWMHSDAMYESLITKLGMPGYTGHNFDALDDSLTDIEVPEMGGMVVALDNFGASPDNETLLDVLARASRYWLLFGRIFMTLLRTDDASYQGPGLAATAPSWNRREWLTDKRKPES